MGNMVVFAIRHDKLDEVKKTSFKEIDEQMHHHEVMNIKTPNGMLTETRFTSKRPYDTGGIMMSGYYHASDGVPVYVDDKKMLTLPCYDFSMKGELDINAESITKAFAKGIRKYSFDHSIRKDPKLATPINTDGVKISLFGLLTDNLNHIDDNVLESLVDIIPEMPEVSAGDSFHSNHVTNIGKYSKRINGITPLATIPVNVSAVVTLYGNSFEVNCLPRHQMPNPEDIEFENGVKPKDFSDAQDKFRELHHRVILNSLGYTMEPKTKK